MANELLARLASAQWTDALVFGLAAFVLHLIAYGWYALEIFRGRTRPNAASWLMWLFGAWVEFETYDAIDSNWSTSALPFACLLGVCVIFITTTTVQVKTWFSGSGGTVYQKPDSKDYYLVLADVGAYVLYLATGGAAWANFIAVSTTIVTFIPIWKTTLRYGNEHPGPWIVWCVAYLMMFAAVVVEGGNRMLVQSFYPVYYFFLTLIVALLAITRIRLYLNNYLAQT